MFVRYAPYPDPYPGSSYQTESRNQVTRHLERQHSAIYCAHPQPSTSMHHFMPAPGNQANTPCSARPMRSAPPHIPTTDLSVLAARPDEGTLSQTTSHMSNRRRLYVRRQVVNVSFDTHLQLFNSLPPRISLNEFMYAATESYETICIKRQAFSKEEETTSLELIENEKWKRLAMH
uniref:Homeobox domain-containing protein n=1 Tax=Mesocestoides corti TaxID=53468 RepID=A0A5K3G3J2_MESCO